MRKKVKSKTPMETPGLYAVTYEDNSVGYEFIPEGKSGEPILPMDAKADRTPKLNKPIPYFRNAQDAMAEYKTNLLKVGEQISKDDAKRFVEEDKQMSPEYKKILMKDLDDETVDSISFMNSGEEDDDEEYIVPESKKGGDF